MFCKKCNGRVFVDRMFTGKSKKSKDSEGNNIELACIMCGKRWTLSKENALAKCLILQEKLRNGALQVAQ